MADLAKYLVRNPKQVIKHLKLLSMERCLITATFGGEDKDSFVTAIMDIDEKKQTITIDCGPKEYLNKKLISSAIIKCTTEYKGIKVQFEGRKVVKSGSPSQPSFIIPIPNSIFWVQRRQFYRIRSPLSKESYCSIPLKLENSEAETVVNFPINDLSASGISFLNESPEHAAQLTASSEFSHCTLTLEKEIPLKIDIEIRHETPNNPNKPGKTSRIGCYITNPTPRIESTILRYMQNIEREIKQISK